MPHLFIVAHCQLKKDILTAFLSIYLLFFFSALTSAGNICVRLLPLIDCTHAHILRKNGIYDEGELKAMPISSELNNYVCPISK